jgi:hypothetical protein
VPNSRALFELGQTVATPGALAALEASGELPATYLTRHQNQDWGNLSSSDIRANQNAVMNGDRVFSLYRLNDGTRLWVITDAADDDGRRASTCILLPEEY